MVNYNQSNVNTTFFCVIRMKCEVKMRKKYMNILHVIQLCSEIYEDHSIIDNIKTHVDVNVQREDISSRLLGQDRSFCGKLTAFN